MSYLGKFQSYLGQIMSYLCQIKSYLCQIQVSRLTDYNITHLCPFWLKKFLLHTKAFNGTHKIYTFRPLRKSKTVHCKKLLSGWLPTWPLYHMTAYSRPGLSMGRGQASTAPPVPDTWQGESGTFTTAPHLLLLPLHHWRSQSEHHTPLCLAQASILGPGEV